MNAPPCLLCNELICYFGSCQSKALFARDQGENSIGFHFKKEKLEFTIKMHLFLAQLMLPIYTKILFWTFLEGTNLGANNVILKLLPSISYLNKHFLSTFRNR